MVSRKGVALEAAERQRGKLDFNTVYETSYANGHRTHVPEDPTYMLVDDLELLLEQNMLVARHRVHSMPVKMRAYSLDYRVPMKWESGKRPKLYLHARPIRIWRRSWLILQINIIAEGINGK